MFDVRLLLLVVCCLLVGCCSVCGVACLFFVTRSLKC